MAAADDIPRELWVQHILPYVAMTYEDMDSLSRVCRWLRRLVLYRIKRVHNMDLGALSQLASVFPNATSVKFNKSQSRDISVLYMPCLPPLVKRVTCPEWIQTISSPNGQLSNDRLCIQCTRMPPYLPTNLYRSPAVYHRLMEMDPESHDLLFRPVIMSGNDDAESDDPSLFRMGCSQGMFLKKDATMLQIQCHASARTSDLTNLVDVMVRCCFAVVAFCEASQPPVVRDNRHRHEEHMLCHRAFYYMVECARRLCDTNGDEWHDMTQARDVFLVVRCLLAGVSHISLYMRYGILFAALDVEMCMLDYLLANGEDEITVSSMLLDVAQQGGRLSDEDGWSYVTCAGDTVYVPPRIANKHNVMMTILLPKLLEWLVQQHAPVGSSIYPNESTRLMVLKKAMYVAHQQLTRLQHVVGNVGSLDTVVHSVYQHVGCLANNKQLVHVPPVLAGDLLKSTIECSARVCKQQEVKFGLKPLLAMLRAYHALPLKKASYQLCKLHVLVEHVNDLVGDDVAELVSVLVQLIQQRRVRNPLRVWLEVLGRGDAAQEAVMHTPAALCQIHTLIQTCGRPEIDSAVLHRLATACLPALFHAWIDVGMENTVQLLYERLAQSPPPYCVEFVLDAVRRMCKHSRAFVDFCHLRNIVPQISQTMRETKLDMMDPHLSAGTRQRMQIVLVGLIALTRSLALEDRHRVWIREADIMRLAIDMYNWRDSHASLQIWKLISALTVRSPDACRDALRHPRFVEMMTFLPTPITFATAKPILCVIDNMMLLLGSEMCDQDRDMLVRQRVRLTQ